MSDRDDVDVPATDLSALDLHADASLADRVIGRAMARIVLSPRSRAQVGIPVLADVARWWTPGLAAAALATIIAGVTVAFSGSTEAGQSDDAVIEARLLDWAQAGVATNEDILSTFGGVAR